MVFMLVFFQQICKFLSLILATASYYAFLDRSDIKAVFFFFLEFSRMLILFLIAYVYAKRSTQLLKSQNKYLAVLWICFIA